jgi:glucan 1,3-beta-glucosidase
MHGIGYNTGMKYRGVNLGGWLILERWITPSLFEGLDARDEFGFCSELGSKAKEVLEDHRKTYIQGSDLDWLKEHGINALRLPVPHWVFGNFEPYYECADHVQWLLDEAHTRGMAVLLDLHTAPGSQNGQDHSGRIGKVLWPETLGNMGVTLAVLRGVAEKWGSHPAVIGLELVNEPSRDINHKLLQEFYEQGIELCRPFMKDKLIVVSDAFRPKDWFDTPLRNQTGVVLDVHLYQAFDAPRRPDVHIKKAKYEWRDLIHDISQSMTVIVGEWSLGLDPKSFRGLDDFERDKALQAFGSAQMQGFSESEGWFFWTYKTETMPGWSYRECVKRGWLPARLLQ